ncbi:DUF3558 domain-containing protein [Streptomyces sp. NPDC014734]|uniref:DUF3558 domain-containing protein n=1 Tax=Streptomyces sp. NPDC014734 TaxID=3364886 RepID=UPI0036F5953F
MAYVPGTALLAALVVGCSAGTGTGGSAADGKAGEATVTTAAPGKYRTLLDACRAVPAAALKNLLPGAAELPEDQQKKAYRGTAAVTYDTDRRVGCRWKAETPGTSHALFIDFERVVSYDPSVSDDDRAREVYTKKQTAAGLTSSTPTPGNTKKHTPPAEGAGTAGNATANSGTGKNVATNDSTNGSTGKDAHADGNGDADTDTKPDTDGNGNADSDGSLLPRTLDGLGDNAFLNDRLVRAGSTAQNRTVSVVFRTSNVIVTIEYTEQPTVPTTVPDSKELQDRARSLARKLVERFAE